jgi:hypothetical protein
MSVNALLPDGAMLTGMIPFRLPDAARSPLLDPAAIAPPLLWLASSAPDETG